MGYYPNNSLKMKLCILGKQMLYKTAQLNGIPYRNCGKWIMAQNAEEVEYLQTLKKRTHDVGVPTHFLPKEKIKIEEPFTRAVEVLVSPTTGIIDSHSLMQFLEGRIRHYGSDVVLNTEVRAIERTSKGYLVETGPEKCIVEADAVVNCAGLYASKIAQMVIPDLPKSCISAHGNITYFCKGHYFGYTGKPLVKRLIYPVPEKNLTGLGVHATIDLAGRMRFGPDTLYVDTPNDYSVNSASRLDLVYEAVSRYLPAVEKEKLFPDYAGIRPKLSGPREPARDFLIEEESARGLPGFVNLLGIESPGLTSSLAIAEFVAGKLNYKSRSLEELEV